MITTWLIASLHLLALALGAGAIVARARLLQRLRTANELPAVFIADNLWGLAAVLWVTTGLARAFGGLEKGTGYYLSQPVFWAKMSLFLVVFAFELRPMITMIRWRRMRRRAEPVDVDGAPTLATLSWVQAGIVVLMVFLATALARGLRV